MSPPGGRQGDRQAGRSRLVQQWPLTGSTWEYQDDIHLEWTCWSETYPDQVHKELARRAAMADKSLRAYLREVLTEHVAVPSTEKWLERLRELGPTHAHSPSGAELAVLARAEDDELLSR